jgi:tRNA-splicing endonuclease subunit Sen2
MATPPSLVPPAPARYKKPNYHLLHALPLPLTVTPLPPLIPHNPLSLLHIVIAYLFPPTSSHPSPLHRGVFHASTRSVHVTDPETIKAFWNHGFFGKGNLSRSEPTWLTRRRRTLGVIGRDEALTAEEVTERRRGERKEFKRERARLEKEKRDRQLAEEGKLTLEGSQEEGGKHEEEANGSASNGSAVRVVHFAPLEPPSSRRRSLESPVVDVEDLEHLQLTLEEAFFLIFGLGVLELTDAATNVRICTLYKYSISLLFTLSFFSPFLLCDARP